MATITITTEYVFMTEQEAYDFVAAEKAKKDIEAVAIKYHKETKKTCECWVATIKERVASIKDYIAYDESDEEDK